MKHLMIASLLFVPSVALAAQPKVAVLNVQTAGIDDALRPLLTEVLTVEVDALNRFQVMSGSDVEAMIGFERQKDLLGCDNASCIAELGGALGVEYIIVSHIGRLGETFVVNIKAIDISKAQTRGRVYESVRGEVDQLLDTIRKSVHKLFPAPAPEAPAQPVAEKTVERPAPHEPSAPAPTRLGTAPDRAASRRIGRASLVLWGLGAVGLGTGIYFGVKTKGYYQNARDTTYVGRQAEIAPGKRTQLIADVAYGVAAASVGAGVAWWLFGGRDTPQVAVVPANDGAALFASLPFGT